MRTFYYRLVLFNMKIRNNQKRNYVSPVSMPAEVVFEKALLVATVRLMPDVDEAENVNAGIEGADEPGGAMYFDF